MTIIVRPVSEALFEDVQTIFGTRGQPARCQCQGYRMGWYAQHSDDVQGRRELLRDQVIEGHGLVAYMDAEPVGWCSLAPRCDYTYLRQTTWKGRDEDMEDASVWAVTCFVTRAGFRHQGVSRALTAGTVDLARPWRPGRRGVPDEARPGQGCHLGRAARRGAQRVPRCRVPRGARAVAAARDRPLRLLGLAPEPSCARVRSCG